jgi:hypothetical protein
LALQAKSTNQKIAEVIAAHNGRQQEDLQKLVEPKNGKLLSLRPRD